MVQGVLPLACLLLLAGCGALPDARRRAIPPAAFPPARGVALLVGIDAYAQPLIGRVPALAGCENDVRRAERVLVERFGFGAEDVLVLTGAAATHAAIVQAFDQHLLQRAASGTRVVFWYSGHGSRTPDLAGVETSKTEDAGAGAFDNTLLAYDSRDQDCDGSYDLVDDELHSLLRALVQRTDQVLVVTDCCHSSGAVRGGTTTAGVRAAVAGRRGFARDAVRAFWPAEVPLVDDDEPDPDVFPYVHIAACGEQQEAGELRVGGRVHGTLSWFLCNALEDVEPGTSWRQLVELVRARVAGCGSRPDQTVIGTGELDRAVFGDDISPPPPGFRVDQMADGLRVDAGRIHGLADGALFDVVGLEHGHRFGTARAAWVASSWCLAAWSEGEPAEVRGRALRALPHADSLRFQPLRVWFGGHLAEDTLAGFPWATASAQPDAEYVLQPGARGLELCDAQGRRLRPVPDDPAGMRQALFREYTFRGLWESVGTRGAWPIALAVEAADAPTRALAERLNTPLATVEPLPAGGNAANVRAVPLTATAGGSLVTLWAQNDADRDLRLTILSVSEDRAVNVVWPRRGESDRILRGGETVRLPVLVGPAADWDAGRPMVDRYLAIATVDVADFTAFTSAAPVWSASRGSELPVPSFLGQLLRQNATRGGEVAEPDFGLAWCDLLLVPPALVDGEPEAR